LIDPFIGKVVNLFLRQKKVAKRSKLYRYDSNAESENVIEPEKSIFDSIAGNWKSYFKNDNPITVELACGKGEYTIGLASKFSDRNFIGIDLKGDRIFVGSQNAQELGLKNVAFVRTRIELIPKIFVPGEIDEIWLTFPDPRPRDRDEKHRLTNIYYLNLYRSLLAKNGWFRFKTDSTPLFDYGLEALKSVKTKNLSHTYDLYSSPMLEEHHGLKTKYEKIWTEKGERIKYLKFQFEN
jgi:tRNA (guanine-N7-)-methyltransferase